MTEELKPEDDLAVPPRWYVVNRDGLATLCADEADARNVADECNLWFPRVSPHRAVQLGNVAAERERCARVAEHQAECNGLAAGWHIAAEIRGA